MRIELSKERIDFSNYQGSKSQNLFVKLCNSIGYKCTKSTKNQDIYQHIDFWIERTDGTTTSVDVKGMNKVNALWIEFKNVNGNDGWMFGDQELIAFDIDELKSFAIVKRVELLNLCRLIIKNEFVNKTNAHKKLYQRKDRKDVISILHLNDIKNLSSYKLLKYED